MTREEFLNVALLQATEEGIGIHLAKFADICIKWGQQHPHWISIEDELPEIGKDVLVLREDGEMQVAHQYNETIARWWSFDGYPLCNNITHWMPLPSIEHLKEK